MLPFQLLTHMGRMSPEVLALQCVALSIGSLNPAPALGYLNSIQNELDGVLQPSIAALSSDLSTLLVRCAAKQQ